MDLYPFSDEGDGTFPLLCRARLGGRHIRRAPRDEAFHPRCAGRVPRAHPRALRRPEGRAWVCSLRHAGVVYAPDTPLAAHGKRLKAGNGFAERGETGKEGYIEPGEKQFRHLEHIAFPYRSGDVLLIASEGQGANKIEPVLTWELPGEPAIRRISRSRASARRT